MRLCASCGRENPLVANFCLHCGAGMVATSPTQREERKVVTVMFADLVGFTARSEQLDTEDRHRPTGQRVFRMGEQQPKVGRP